jgi:hypothetical protein
MNRIIKNQALIIVILCSNLVFSQSYDSTVYSDYYLVLNSPLSRTTHFNAGVERIKPLNKKLYYSSLITFSGGLQNGNFSPHGFYNPAYYSLCFQPFHLLTKGKRNFQFETGPSCVLTLYRLFGKQYALTDSFRALYDELSIIYMVGLRYTFPKWQLGIKLMIGPKYFRSLQHNYSSFSDAHSAEFGLNWRFRRKVRVVLQVPD